MTKVDFRTMIQRIADEGVTQTDLAERVGCTKENMSRIKGGQEPRYNLGAQIVGEYVDIVGREIPRIGS